MSEFIDAKQFAKAKFRSGGRGGRGRGRGSYQQRQQNTAPTPDQHEEDINTEESGERWEDDAGLDSSHQTCGEDLETLLADAEHFYGQAYYRYLAIQQQTREDVEGALPGLGQTSTAPEQAFLDLDLDALAASLGHLPLHELLGIEPEYLEELQHNDGQQGHSMGPPVPASVPQTSVPETKQAAVRAENGADALASYPAGSLPAGEPARIHNLAPVSYITAEGKAGESSLNSVRQSSTAHPVPKPLLASPAIQSHQGKTPQASSAGTILPPTVRSVSNAVTPAASVSAPSMGDDEELDNLLASSVSTPASSSVKLHQNRSVASTLAPRPIVHPPTTGAHFKAPPVAVKNEDDLDQILGLPRQVVMTSKSSSLQQQPQPHPPKTSAVKEGDTKSLEDWLDGL